MNIHKHDGFFQDDMLWGSSRHESKYTCTLLYVTCDWSAASYCAQLQCTSVWLMCFEKRLPLQHLITYGFSARIHTVKCTNSYLMHVKQQVLVQPRIAHGSCSKQGLYMKESDAYAHNTHVYAQVQAKSHSLHACAQTCKPATGACTTILEHCYESYYTHQEF